MKMNQSSTDKFVNIKLQTTRIFLSNIDTSFCIQYKTGQPWNRPCICG